MYFIRLFLLLRLQYIILRKRSHGLELYAVQSSFLRKILYTECCTLIFIESLYFNDTLNVF